MTWTPARDYNLCEQKISAYMLKLSNDLVQQVSDTIILNNGQREYEFPTKYVDNDKICVTVKLCAIKGAKEGLKRTFQVKGSIKDSKIEELTFKDVCKQDSIFQSTVENVRLTYSCKGDVIEDGNSTCKFSDNCLFVIVLLSYFFLVCLFVVFL